MHGKWTNTARATDGKAEQRNKWTTTKQKKNTRAHTKKEWKNKTNVTKCLNTNNLKHRGGFEFNYTRERFFFAVADTLFFSCVLLAFVVVVLVVGLSFVLPFFGVLRIDKIWLWATVNEYLRISFWSNGRIIRNSAVCHWWLNRRLFCFVWFGFVLFIGAARVQICHFWFSVIFWRLIIFFAEKLFGSAYFY